MTNIDIYIYINFTLNTKGISHLPYTGLLKAPLSSIKSHQSINPQLEINVSP